MYVAGVPNKQPNTPGGPWMFDLGVVTGQSACPSIPSSKVFRIMEEPSGHETRVVWTTAGTLTLGLVRRPCTRTDTVEVLAAPAMDWMALLLWRRTPREQGAAA